MIVVVSVSQRIHGDEVDFLNGNCMVNVPLPWMRNGEQWNNLYGNPTTDHMIIYVTPKFDRLNYGISTFFTACFCLQKVTSKIPLNTRNVQGVQYGKSTEKCRCFCCLQDQP